MSNTVSCPSCDTSFPVDPEKIPPEGVRAQCSVCPEIFDVNSSNLVTADAAPSADPIEPGTVDLPPLAAEPEAAEAEADDSGPIRFGRRSPEDKAKSLARSLVSDLVAYNPDKHKEALAAGTLQDVFGDEIEKSLKEYQEQVEPDVMSKGTFFNDALNSILAEGQSVFTVDG